MSSWIAEKEERVRAVPYKGLQPEGEIPSGIGIHLQIKFKDSYTWSALHDHCLMLRKGAEPSPRS